VSETVVLDPSKGCRWCGRRYYRTRTAGVCIECWASLPTVLRRGLLRHHTGFLEHPMEPTEQYKAALFAADAWAGKHIAGATDRVKEARRLQRGEAP